MSLSGEGSSPGRSLSSPHVVLLSNLCDYLFILIVTIRSMVFQVTICWSAFRIIKFGLYARQEDKHDTRDFKKLKYYLLISCIYLFSLLTTRTVVLCTLYSYKFTCVKSFEILRRYLGNRYHFDESVESDESACV